MLLSPLTTLISKLTLPPEKLETSIGVLAEINNPARLPAAVCEICSTSPRSPSTTRLQLMLGHAAPPSLLHTSYPIAASNALMPRSQTGSTAPFEKTSRSSTEGAASTIVRAPETPLAEASENAAELVASATEQAMRHLAVGARVFAGE